MCTFHTRRRRNGNSPAVDTGEGKGPADGKLQARVSFGDGRSYDRGGHVDFTDSNLDLQTGTVLARAIIPNPESKLRPGQFVRVSVEGITRHETIVIPQAAVMQGPQGRFVYAVDTENKASIRPVTIGREVADGWIVEKGLQAGDRIVTEGVIKVKPGASAARGSGQARRSARSWSAPSSPTSASSTSLPHSPRSRWSADW